MAKSSPPLNKLQQIHFSIGIAMMEWQGVELALTQLFVLLVQAQGGVASAIFNSVLGFRTKLDMVRAAAFVRLQHSPLADECMKLCDRLEKKSKKRNEIAHFMLLQTAAVFKPDEEIDIEKLEDQIDWYLSPTYFDGAIRRRYGENVPKLKAVDIQNRTFAFHKVSRDIWDLSERVGAFLKLPAKPAQLPAN